MTHFWSKKGHFLIKNGHFDVLEGCEKVKKWLFLALLGFLVIWGNLSIIWDLPAPRTVWASDPFCHKVPKMSKMAFWRILAFSRCSYRNFTVWHFCTKVLVAEMVLGLGGLKWPSKSPKCSKWRPGQKVVILTPQSVKKESYRKTVRTWFSPKMAKMAIFGILGHLGSWVGSFETSQP